MIKINYRHQMKTCNPRLTAFAKACTIATLGLLNLCCGVERVSAQSSTDPKPILYQTLASVEETYTWRPRFANLAAFTDVVSREKSMTTLEVGDFYVGWRIDATEDNTKKFVFCYYLKDPTAKQWDFGADLNFVDATGNKIGRVSTSTPDQKETVVVLRAEAHPTETEWGASEKSIIARGRVLPTVPAGTVGVLCEMSGSRDDVPSSGSTTIPIAKVLSPPPAH